MQVVPYPPISVLHCEAGPTCRSIRPHTNATSPPSTSRCTLAHARHTQVSVDINAHGRANPHSARQTRNVCTRTRTWRPTAGTVMSQAHTHTCRDICVLTCLPMHTGAWVFPLPECPHEHRPRPPSHRDTPCFSAQTFAVWNIENSRIPTEGCPRQSSVGFYSLPTGN